MSARPARRIRRLPCAVLAAAVAGCASPTAPPDPPGGGAEWVADYEAFVESVAPVLAANGCHTAQCHGGGIRGTYRLSPEDAPDPAFDFEQTRLQVNPWSPPDSPVLAKPLAAAAGGTPHSHEPFEDRDHPGYVAIRDWILAGELR